jgi:hypothetical protein
VSTKYPAGTATLTFLAPQTFDRACDRLQEAQASYTDAANALAETKCSLEFKRAELLDKGIDGKNAEAREAALRLKLFDEYTELLGLEVTLNEAKKELEQARITWDCLRYKLRLLEVQKVLEGAA